MKKIALTLTAFSIMTAGLAGCNMDDQAMNPGRTDGQYVGEQGQGNNLGNMNVTNRGQRGDRGEGPITDMFTVDDRTQRTDRAEGTRNMTDGQGSVYYNNQRDVSDRGNFNAQEQRMNENRANQYNGQTGDRPGMINERGLMNQDQNGNNGNNNNNGDADKISDLVTDMDGVDRAHVVVRDEDVVIAVDTDEDAADNTIDSIRQEVEDRTDKNVHVTDENDAFNDLGNIERDMREGTGEIVDETWETLDDMIRDIGNAAQRPFERSR